MTAGAGSPLGVLVANLGTPDAPDAAAVRRYLAEFLADRRVVEFALGVPGALYRHGGCSRWLMRQALRNLLPPAVRRNTNKTEPARATARIRATVQALAEVRLEIDAAKAPLLRSQYIDMERLRKSLAAPRTPERPRLMRIMGALQLLDF